MSMMMIVYDHKNLSVFLCLSFNLMMLMIMMISTIGSKLMITMIALPVSK